MGNGGSTGSRGGVSNAIGGALAGVSPLLPFPLSLVTGLGGTAASLIGKLVGDDPVVAQEAYQQLLQQNPQLAQQIQILPPGPQLPPATPSQTQTTPSSVHQGGEITQLSGQTSGMEDFLGRLREANRLQSLGPFTHAPTRQNLQIDQLLSSLGQGHLTKPTMGQVPVTSQIAPNTAIANKLGPSQLIADVAEQHYVKPSESAIVSNQAGATTPLDSVVSRIVSLSEAVGIIQIPNFNLTPLPIGGFLPTYNISGGGRKFRLAAIQPVDSFVNPGGSNDYQLFYPVKTQSSLRTTIGYHEFGHPLYSDTTANNPFAY